MDERANLIDGPNPLAEPRTGLTIERATAQDVPAIVAILSADERGRLRETDPNDPAYRAAFEQIDGNPRDLLVVARENDVVVGVLQLTFLTHLTHRGATRAQIETVHVAESARNRGVGGALVGWAIDYAREHGARMVQLTSHASRSDAHRFYERLGFAAEHKGFKLQLEA